MITVTASPSLPTNPLMSVADGTVTANSALLSGAAPIEGFSNTLTSQINLLVQPTADISTLAQTVEAKNTSIVNPETIVNQNVVSENVVSEQVLFQNRVLNPQILNPTSPTAMSEIVMNEADSAILSSVNDTLKFIATGSKLGDTLSTGQTVQLPTTNLATPITQQTVQNAVQQAVTNPPVTTSAAVLAQQVAPVHIPESVQIETQVIQQSVTSEKAGVENLVVSQTVTAEKAVVPQTVTAEKAVVPQTVTSEKAVVPQTATPEKIAVVNPVESPIVKQLTTNTKTDKKSDIKLSENTPAEPVVLSIETAVLQNIVAPENAIVEQQKPEQPKLENQTPPIFVEQSTAEIVAPIVTAQATPTQIETETAIFETENKSVTPDEKPTLTSAKNLLMEAVANRNNTNGNSTNSNSGGNTSSNPTLQTELVNHITDNKTGVTDTKSFASLLAAEKPETVSSSATASTTEKSAPQNISAAVNKLVQDTKIDVPAMTRPLSHPAWNQEMGERIVWMNNQGISSAEIKMNPQNMGPITVRIDMNQDQATIAFTAQNSEVRTALENSIPKLREMLTSQNVNLAEVNVSQQSSNSTNSDSNRQQQTAQMMADASANGQGNRQNNPEVDSNGNVVRQTGTNGEEIAVDEFANGHILETNGTNGLLSVFA
ncbi:MAG: flagellar hook-length control protein FliK [Methylococcaceae bacterium]